MSERPEQNAAWKAAKRASPVLRPAYSDNELVELRIFYSPLNHDYATDHQEAAVIWGLLDIVERLRGWAREGDS